MTEDDEIVEAMARAIQNLMPDWLAEDGRVDDLDLGRAALRAYRERMELL